MTPGGWKGLATASGGLEGGAHREAHLQMLLPWWAQGRAGEACRLRGVGEDVEPTGT